MTGRIILVRHGQTTSNVVRKIDTLPPGAELTAMGRYQAHRVGAELAEFCGVAPGHAGRIRSVTTSVAIRAQQTTMIMARALEQAAGLPNRALNVQVRTGLHEVAAGDYEMRNDDEAHRGYARAMFGWLRGDPQARAPRGENYTQLLDRYQPVLEELAGTHAAGDAVVVSHGAAIRTVASHAAGLEPTFALENYLNNCRFVVLEPGDRNFGHWSVAKWGDTF
ncbi:MAG TPA: histidine phosphatase family protein [Corynebacterium sp.]|nr:histidine phosphatase family protein [Corynebacterium sp.]